MEVQTRRNWWYALPIVGAAIPIAVILTRRLSEEPCVPKESKEERLLKEASIDLRSAMNTALKYVAGTPVEVELDESDGVPVWEVQVVPKHGGPTREVLIDARSGDLLEMKAEQSGKMKCD